MPVRFVLIVSLLLSTGGPALAQDNQAPAAAAANAPAPAPAVKEKQICQSDVDTGSIMPHRVCHTKSEWAEIAKQNAAQREQFDDQTRRHSGGFGH